MKKIESQLFLTGVSTYFLFSEVISYLRKNDFGARADSVFYFKMFNSAKMGNGFIPLDKYEVATSPIYVALVGLSKFVVGSNFPQVVHISYYCMAIGSIYLLTKILQPRKFTAGLPFVILLSSSGYFVAPSLWPTSDTPAIFFSLMTLRFFLSGRSVLFGLACFLLVSTRQSFAWLVIAYSIFELMDNREGRKSAKSYFKYFPTFVSLVITFVYFDLHTTPVLYQDLQIQNSFKIPNFLNSIQIGLALLLILLVAQLSNGFKLNYLKIEGKILYFVLLLSSIPILYNFYGAEQSLFTHNPHGWISLFSSRLHISIFWVSISAGIGIFLMSSLILNLGIARFNLLFYIFVSFLLLTISMPIPFLRYFEFPVILISSFTLHNVALIEKAGSNWRNFCLTGSLLVMNCLIFLS